MSALQFTQWSARKDMEAEGSLLGTGPAVFPFQKRVQLKSKTVNRRPKYPMNLVVFAVKRNIPAICRGKEHEMTELKLP